MRRVGAILAGFVAVVTLSSLTDEVMHRTHIFPPPAHPMSDALWWLATSYRFAYVLVGNWIVARLAPDHRAGHLVALAVLGTAAGVAGVIATWHLGPEFGPKWYAISVCAGGALALPIALRGFKPL